MKLAQSEKQVKGVLDYFDRCIMVRLEEVEESALELMAEEKSISVVISGSVLEGLSNRAVSAVRLELENESR